MRHHREAVEHVADDVDDAAAVSLLVLVVNWNKIIFLNKSTTDALQPLKISNKILFHSETIAKLFQWLLQPLLPKVAKLRYIFLRSTMKDLQPCNREILL